ASIASSLGSTHPSDCAVLLSGGIDSAILQIVFGSLAETSPLQSRSYVIEETPEYYEELTYCCDVVRILRTQHEYTAVRPTEYPNLLLETVAALGIPFGHEAQPAILRLLRALAATGPTMLWCGRGADSIYGTSDAIIPRYSYLPENVLRGL